MTPPTYEVLLATPSGDAVLDVPTYQGPAAAGRRAYWTAVSLGWGEADQITVVSSVRLSATVMPDA